MKKSNAIIVLDAPANSEKATEKPKDFGMFFWLVVSTHLKNISQNGNLPQVGVKIKNI